MKNTILFIVELVKLMVVSFAIMVPIRYFLIQPFYVKGSSMEPNFYNNEYLIIDEISYQFNEPKRGDIVVFKYPKNPKEYFIKRLIGLPGEEVQIKDGHVYIYNKENPEGFKLEESYLPSDAMTYYYGNTAPDEKIKINANQFFVLGDNRNASKDSRSFGPVDEGFVIGKVLLRGFPFDKIKVFGQQEYQY